MKLFNWKSCLVGIAISSLALMPSLSFAAPLGADVITVVDESGSMGGEHAFLTTAISNLDADLQAAGVTLNNYGLVGYGGHSAGGANSGHTHLVGGSDYGTAAQYSTAAGTLVTSGSIEDGYAGINFALNNYALRAGNFAHQIILVTDEDRDNTNAALTAPSMLAALKAAGVVLNVIVNNGFTVGGVAAIGVSADGTAYVADGAGGFTAMAGGVVGNGDGTTETDYVALAHATGGAAWNLNILRSGGLNAQSFSAAFTAIKVQEIIIVPPPNGGGDPIPEPATVILFGTGLAGLAAWRMRKAKQA